MIEGMPLIIQKLKIILDGKFQVHSILKLTTQLIGILQTSSINSNKKPF